MATASRLLLIAAFAALALRGSAEDDFDLSDALDDPLPKPPSKPTKRPAQNEDYSDLDFDMFDKTTKVPKTTTTKAPPRITPGRKVVTPKPKPITRAPPRPPAKPDPDDFDLRDALDENNDKKGGGRGGKSDLGFSDKDLEDLAGDGYTPDKTRDGNDSPSDQGNNGSLEQTGTIAGIASALAMALIGAVSSYISYQQKKFCFSIQEGLNAEYAKGQAMEGVTVAVEEPQVQQTLLKSESAEPPTADNTKI